MTALVEPVTQELPLHVDEHGAIRIGRSRVTLDTIVAVWRQGATPEQIVQDFDTLALSDVYAAILYYLLHQDEVEAYLEQRRVHAEEVRRQVEARCPPDGLRQRLLARRSQKA